MPENLGKTTAPDAKGPLLVDKCHSKTSFLQLSIISSALKGLKGKDFKESYLLYSSPVNPKKVTAEMTANLTL